MQGSSRARAAQAAKQLYNLRETSEILLVKQLLEALLEEAKDGLLTATLEGFSKKQGEALAYDKLLRMLTRSTPGVI